MLKWTTTSNGTRVVYGKLREVKAGYSVICEGEEVYIDHLGKPHRIDGILRVYGYPGERRVKGPH